ncbi:MAG: macro domain protein [Betaproteobacteria bacterium]|nr:macro domain protein [Betaproteobacteria bacterium]
MISFTEGNLLEASAEALVNTVNTVGVMGKGIALMFKERFPKNYQYYVDACKAKKIQVGKVFASESEELGSVRWVINFPTKQHWRNPSKLEWIEEGLQDLKLFLVEHNIKSVAIPPLGAGNGGLDWQDVRALIVKTFSNLDEIHVQVFEPTKQYQNVAKRTGIDKLTPARALIAELVRRYWILGIECSLLEIQKLSWFLEREVEKLASDNPLDLRFEANKFGPYAERLRHLLNGLDGSYLHCEKRISDADPLDIIWFDDDRKDHLQIYLKSPEVKPYLTALEATARLIDGFESPFGMELLATVDWLVKKEGCEPTVSSIQEGLRSWPAGKQSAERKSRLFDDRVISIALERLSSSALIADS